MHETTEFAVRALMIGAGATVVMDVWAVFLKRFFGIPSLDYAMVGRWLGHLPRGRFVHDSIGKAVPVRCERIIGWAAHYAIGMIFAAFLIGAMGLDWARQPTFLPALLTGMVTVAAPFFILQPGLGVGIAASKTPRPNVFRLRSLMAHTAFGVGLYLSAWVVAMLLQRVSA